MVCTASHRNDLSLVSGKWYTTARFQSSSDNQHVAEHQCCVTELTGHIGGLLVGIPVVHHPLVASHRGAVRPIRAKRRKHALALNEQHVAQMTSVLQRRPHRGSPPGPHVHLAVAQDRHGGTDPLVNRLPGGRGLSEVVDETALRTLIRHRDVPARAG
jgi:diadenosine tetraphosphatase ApaH/serine/threonine PP2A family protein phosphatase